MARGWGPPVGVYPSIKKRLACTWHGCHPPFDRVALWPAMPAPLSGINLKAAKVRAVTLHMTKPPAALLQRAAMIGLLYAYRLRYRLELSFGLAWA